MHLHMLSIIPLITGMILITIGLWFLQDGIVTIGILVLTSGLAIHASNIAVIRKLIKAQTLEQLSENKA